MCSGIYLLVCVSFSLVALTKGAEQNTCCFSDASREHEWQLLILGAEHRRSGARATVVHQLLDVHTSAGWPCCHGYVRLITKMMMLSLNRVQFKNGTIRDQARNRNRSSD